MSITRQVSQPDSGQAPLTIAIIGTGEMGAGMGRRLREAGARVITSLNGRGAPSADRVRRAGLEVADGDDQLVNGVDLILSIVPPGVAVEVAGRLRDPMQKSAKPPAFADCNAIAPSTARKIAGALDPLRFIDAGIIGGPPAPSTQDPAKGPRLYASGPHAHLLAQLEGYGIGVIVMEGPIGAASGLKLAYAGLTKGLTALGAAMITAASRDGLADALRNELARSQPQLLARLDRFVPTMFPKAYRWVAEMEQIAEFIGDPAAGATIYEGAARLFEGIAQAIPKELEDGSPQGPFASLARFCQPPQK